MMDEERVWLLRDLEDHATLVQKLSTAAREYPQDADRLLTVCDAIFAMRELLDELGVWYARVANDDWDRIVSVQTGKELGLDHAKGMGSVPFPVFGLPHGLLAQRTLGSIGSCDGVIELVSLEHTDGTAWVSVAVTGPIHMESGRSSLPGRMIATEFLNLLGVDFATGGELEGAVRSIWESHFSETAIEVDGKSRTFRTLERPEGWLAIHDLEPDCTLYVLGRAFPLASLRLERLDDLAPYLVVPSPAAR